MQSLFDLIPEEPKPAKLMASRVSRKRKPAQLVPIQPPGVVRWLQGRSLALQKFRGMSPGEADAKALAEWLQLEREESKGSTE